MLTTFASSSLLHTDIDRMYYYRFDFQFCVMINYRYHMYNMHVGNTENFHKCINKSTNCKLCYFSKYLVEIFDCFMYSSIEWNRAL